MYIASLDRKGDIQALLLAIESCYAKRPTFNTSGKKSVLFLHLYKHAISPIFHKTLPYIVWENGPIILPKLMEKTEKDTVYRDIILTTIQKAQERRCYSLAFARPAFFNYQPLVFSSLNFEKKRMGTILVNLKQPLEDLWKHVDRQTRKNIEKTRTAIQIERVRNLADLRLFYDMHLENCRRAKVRIRPFSFFSSLWTHFSPHEKIVGFVAYCNGRLLGSIICLAHNLTTHVFGLGDSDFVRLNRVYVLDALIWHSMNWARERDFKYFDLSGVELHKIDAGDTKALGILRYKSKWGGQLVEYHDYRKTLRSRKTVSVLNRFLSEGDGFHN